MSLASVILVKQIFTLQFKIQQNTLNLIKKLLAPFRDLNNINKDITKENSWNGIVKGTAISVLTNQVRIERSFNLT